MVDQAPACKVIRFAEDIGSDADQETFQLALVPLGKQLRKFVIGEAPNIFEQQIALRNQLHIRVFDAVVHHFNIVTRAVRPDIGAAGHPLRSGCNSFQNGLDRRIGIFVAARHDGRAVPRALLAARDADAEIQDALFRKFCAAAAGVLKERVTAVQNDVALLEQRLQLADHRIHRRAGLNHQHDAARARKRGHHLLQRVKRRQVFVGMLSHDLLGHSAAAVVARDLKTVIRHIERKAASHNG